MSETVGAEAEDVGLAGKSDSEIRDSLVERFRARREAAEAEAAPAPKQVARRPAPEPEPEVEEETELEAAEAEGEEDLEEAEVEGEDEAEPDAAGETLTIARLAKHWEMKPEEVLSSIMVEGLDGKTVPLAEVVEAYRRPAPERVEMERTTARLRELETTEQQRTERYDLRMGQLQDLAQLLLDEVEKEKEPDERLLASNPTEYSVQHIRWVKRQEALRTALGALRQHRDEKAAQRQALEREYRADQGRKLRAAIPEWSSDSVFRRDFERIIDYALKQGFSQEELVAATDHRQWLVLRKAMMHDSRPSKEDVLRKGKLARIPKTLRPGAAQQTVNGSPRTQQQKGLDAALAKLRQTGKTKDAEALVLARIRSRGAQEGAARGRP